MPITRTLRVGNAERLTEWTNAKDASQAEALLEEERNATTLAEEMALERTHGEILPTTPGRAPAQPDDGTGSATKAGKGELAAQNEALKAEAAKKDAQIKDLKARIDTLMSPEEQVRLAKELLEQNKDEEAILKAEDADGAGEPQAEGTGAKTDESAGAKKTAKDKDTKPKEDKTTFANSLKDKTLEDRRRAVVARVMNGTGQDVAQWPQEAVDGAFRVMALNARTALEKEAVRMANGGMTGNGGVNKNENVSRGRAGILDAIRNKNPHLAKV